MDSHLGHFFDALESRHLAELEWAEVTRALRALSSAYVQRRAKLAGGAALDGRGKRAAFALFYGPLHFAAVAHVVSSLKTEGEAVCAPSRITDLGCGTGAGAAAWAAACQTNPRVVGLDIHPWAVAEAEWTYRYFALNGTARRADLAKAAIDPRSALVAAFTLNELDEAVRNRIIEDAMTSKRAFLVVEPISRAITPWWDRAAADVIASGGRADDWKTKLVMPERWRLLDRAAGFRRDHLTARSLWLPAQ